MSLITPYQPLPITFERGQGIWLWDTDGRQYLDALTGIAVCGLGHTHPAVTKTITEQAQKLIHTSNVYQISHQIALAEKLCELTNMEQVFFANSGAEANETAIKLARLYGHQRNIENPKTIVMEGAFHGRTMATLTASGNRKFHAGFEPLVPGFVRAPYNDVAALQKIADDRDDVVAVMLEPIQGEGGVVIPDPGYLAAVRQLCDQHNWLLMVDEVQSGVARTGSLYAYQSKGIQPDVLMTAKGLGNGIPIGACLMHGPAVGLFKVGMHGSTFGGNPLSCAVALTVLDTIEQTNLCQHVQTMGEYLIAKLEETLGNHSFVRNIRGEGLMVGIELDEPCRPLMKNGLEHGVLFNVTADSVIRLLPPLIITDEEIDELVDRLRLSIEDFRQ